MPTELNRIRELSGLQQEAEPQNTADDLISTITKLAQDALEKSNFDLKPFRPLAPKIQKLVTIKSPNYDGSQADAFYNIWNSYPTKLNPKDFPSKADYEDLVAYLMKQLISIGRNYLKLPPYNFDKFEKPTKPTNLTAQQKQGLAALVKKYANRKTYGGGGLIDGYLDYLAQTGIWTDAADEKEFDVALKKLGHKDLAAWEKRAQGEEFEQFLELAPITGQAQNDVAKVLGKGFENNEELISAASRYVRSLPETAVQPEPVLNAAKETPVTSQVDEAIKKATAQLKSFSNFDGLKPYKPKKK
jgi:hypothetical protein